MALVSRHDVTMRLVLDEQQRPYFPGESIRGKVLLACPQSIHPHALRLIWAGGVTIQPTPQNHESFLYFKRTFAICDNKLKGKRVGTGWTFKASAFVENYDTASAPLSLVLEQSVTYSFSFDVQVPVDVLLPSSTETEGSMLGGSILYTLECCLDLVKDDPTPAQTHIEVTVLEHMDVRLPELNIPRTKEAAYSLWLRDTPKTSPCDYRTAMRVTLPCQAAVRGGQIDIDMHVWHSVGFQLPKGVTVRLLRVRQLHYQGSDYAFPDETVLSMRADVDLTEDNKYIQALHCVLPIREDVTPSISDAARLLEISYKVHVKVQLQEGAYKTLTGETQGFMSVEIPILIGTVPLTIGNKIVSPRNHLTSRRGTNDSKKSNGSKENDTTTAISGGLHKKLSASNDALKGQKTSKHESPPPVVEKKNKSFWRSVPIPRIKPKPPNSRPIAHLFTGSPTGYGDDNDPFEDEQYQQLSDISSAKNTDLSYPPNSSNDGSHTSQSASSPRTETDTLPPHLQKLYEPDDTTQHCVKISPTAVENKPDERDDRTSTLCPISNTTNALDVPRTNNDRLQSRSSSLNNSSSPTSPSSNSDPVALPHPSKVTAPPAPTSGQTAHVRVVNIFVSSDEEDDINDEEVEQKKLSQQETDNTVLGNSDDRDGVLKSNMLPHPSGSRRRHQSSRQNTGYQGDSDTDDSDNSPLTLLSRQPHTR